MFRASKKLKMKITLVRDTFLQNVITAVVFRWIEISFLYRSVTSHVVSSCFPPKTNRTTIVF
jgi:hypothetical protein